MKWYTYKEVAEMLQVSVPIVRRWARTGNLNVARITHKTVRISQESLDAFLQSRKGQNGNEGKV